MHDDSVAFGELSANEKKTLSTMLLPLAKTASAIDILYDNLETNPSFAALFPIDLSIEDSLTNIDRELSVSHSSPLIRLWRHVSAPLWDERDPDATLPKTVLLDIIRIVVCTQSTKEFLQKLPLKLSSDFEQLEELTLDFKRISLRHFNAKYPRAIQTLQRIVQDIEAYMTGILTG